MRSTFCSAAFLGAAVVSAIPAPQGWGYDWNQQDLGWNNQDYRGKDQFPMDDGFPNPNRDELIKIEETAKGTLSNMTAPPKGSLNDDTILSLQLVVTNEFMEVSFFQQFLNNITNGADGFKNININNDDGQYLVDSLKVIIAVCSNSHYALAQANCFLG